VLKIIHLDRALRHEQAFPGRDQALPRDGAKYLASIEQARRDAQDLRSFMGASASEAILTMTTEATIDTGDTVHFLDTGEDLIVARVEDGYLWWLGWPPGRAKLERFTLTTKATPERRRKTLEDLAYSGHSCRQWAVDRLIDDEIAAGKGGER